MLSCCCLLCVPTVQVVEFPYPLACSHNLALSIQEITLLLVNTVLLIVSVLFVTLSKLYDKLGTYNTLLKLHFFLLPDGVSTTRVTESLGVVFMLYKAAFSYTPLRNTCNYVHVDVALGSLGYLKLPLVHLR